MVASVMNVAASGIIYVLKRNKIKYQLKDVKNYSKMFVPISFNTPHTLLMEACSFHRYFTNELFKNHDLELVSSSI